jgi:hypothetical protein
MYHFLFLFLLNLSTQMLRSSLLSLGRKVLSYRDIDTDLVVACMIMLPCDTMVRELKAAVPSIQSDFSRLRTVAAVGEELARIWDQEGLLIVFQGLQANAKWWHILSSHGVKIDPRAFQSSDAVQRDVCIRTVVPELLERNGMDLEQAVDYCRQFDVEPEFATLCYIEKVLLLPPAITASSGGSMGTMGGINNPSDAAWAREIRRAVANVEERTVLRRMRALLNRVHPLDYEKIRFVCAWILEALNGDEEGDNGDDIGDNDDGCENDDDENARDGGNRTRNVTFAATDDTNAKKKRVAAAAAVAVDDTTRSLGALAAEVDMCRRYSDIATFLSSLSVPVHAAQALITATDSADNSNNAVQDTVPDLGLNVSLLHTTMGSALPMASVSSSSLASCYSGVPESYMTRIPFWPLLSDPWSIIGPLLASAPEVAAKLSPLCRALGIEKVRTNTSFLLVFLLLLTFLF